MRASGPPRTARAAGTWKRFHLAPSYRLALGFVAGAAAGLLFGARAMVAMVLQPLADIFIAALQAVGPPVALFALLSSLFSFSAGNLTRLGLRALGWYLGTGLAASLIGVLVAHALSVGAGFELHPASAGTAANAMGAPHAGRGVMDDLKSVLQGPIPHIVFWALFVAQLASSPRRTEPAHISRWSRLLDECTQVSYRVLNWLMVAAPIGVFALMAVTFAQMRITAVAHLVMVLVAVYVAQAISCVGCALVLLWSSKTPAAFLRGASEALLTAFATGSSAAAMPVEIAAAEQKLGIDRRWVGLFLPLGLAIHKLGTAAYLAAVLVFAANVASQELTPEWLLWLTLLTLAASVITPPVSGGAWVALGFVAGGASLPMAAIAVAAGIPLMGKLNTPINSLGRLVSVVVLSGRTQVLPPRD